jgi:CarboxypepD_reg-like domain/X-Pro dipeptidyl-peptidase (S15 family)
MKHAPLLALMLTGYFSLAQQVGYRNMVLTDSSRRYKPGDQPGDRLCYRPVEIDCWYPAESIGEKPILYGEFLQLFQQRANRFQDDTVYSSLAGEIARYLCAGLGIMDTASLTGLATQSYRDASPIHQQFPLIVYMCSYNGMCYENTRLFEVLARRGYIVASVTSVGRYPGNMTTDPADLREQVADGLFTINMLRKSGTVDTAKMGVIGYSWGGPAAFLLSDNPYVTAILSLDGSELHYYGQSGEEDSNFNRLRPSLSLAAKSQFAYAYLESDGKQSEGAADSIYNVLPVFQGPKKYLRFPGATHEDLSCLRFLAASIRKTDSGALPNYPAFAVSWFDNYLKNCSNTLPRNSLYPVVSRSQDATTIAGKIIDAEDKTPLAYVNIGIPRKNAGTVTREDGSFKLDINPQLANDSLAVSMVGYEKQVIPLRKLPKTIVLQRRGGGLSEVVVTSGIRRSKIVGNTTTSMLVSVGFPTRFLGSEMGVRMTLGKHPRHLEKFHCHVSYIRVDSAVFRLNIFRVVNGKPENVMPRNILLSVGKAPGDYTVDLSGLNLVLPGDILVSLELLRTYSTLTNPGAVFFSAALFNSGTWHRLTSQAEWTKTRGIGVGFNVEVR